MKHVVGQGSGGMVYIPRFIEIGTDVQAILRCCLSNLEAVMLVLLTGGNHETGS
jgi:hypothetical protein